MDGKLFAVGGGDGSECFSDVEMFDPNIGRWISARSMLQKVVYLFMFTEIKIDVVPGKWIFLISWNQYADSLFLIVFNI